MTCKGCRIVSGSSGPPVRLCPFPPQLPPPISTRLDISFGFEMWFNVWALVGSPIPGMTALTTADLSCAPLDAADRVLRLASHQTGNVTALDSTTRRSRRMTWAGWTWPVPDAAPCIGWTSGSWGRRPLHRSSTCVAVTERRYSRPFTILAQLRGLYTSNLQHAVQFRENIQRYNGALAFTSVNYEPDSRVNGGYRPFQIQGELYHRQGPLESRPGVAPTYAQVWFHEPALAKGADRGAPGGELLRGHLQDRPGTVGDRGIRSWRWNRGPIAVGRIYEPSRIVVLDRALYLWLTLRALPGRVSLCHLSYLPLHYVLLFPHGDHGWYPEFPRAPPTARAGSACIFFPPVFAHNYMQSNLLNTNLESKRPPNGLSVG
ncbi:hypothetical protein V8E54_011544 [Elaphomyces granulatus]